MNNSVYVYLHTDDYHNGIHHLQDDWPMRTKNDWSRDLRSEKWTGHKDHLNIW